MDAARVLGMALEVFFNLCFTVGGNGITAGDFPDTIEVSLDGLGRQGLLLGGGEKQAAMRIGADIREQLHQSFFVPLQANVPVYLGGSKVGEHDIIADLLRPHGVPKGRFSIEVRVRRARDNRHLEGLMPILRREAWDMHPPIPPSLHPSIHWWQTVQLQQHWAGRLLIVVGIPEVGLAPHSLRAERRLLQPGGAWTPLFVVPRPAVAIPQPLPQPAPAPKAAPKAAAKAKAKAAARAPWTTFKGRCGPWKDYGGKSVASVKTFLKAAAKPYSNTTRSVDCWKGMLAGRIHGTHFFTVGRNLFATGGSRPGGGSKMPAASEEALSLVYETYCA